MKLPDLTQLSRRGETAHTDLEIESFRDLVTKKEWGKREYFIHTYTHEGAIYRRDFLSDLIDIPAFRAHFERAYSALPSKPVRRIEMYGQNGQLTFEAVQSQIRQLHKWVLLPKTLELLAELPGGSQGSKDLRAFAKRARRSLQDFALLGERLSVTVREHLDDPSMDAEWESDEMDSSWFAWAEHCIDAISPHYKRLEEIAKIRGKLDHYRTLCKPYEWKIDGKRIPSCKPVFLDPEERRGTIINAYHPLYFKWRDIVEMGKNRKTVLTSLNVPNDIRWGPDARNTFIQGANSMGKSVYLETIALNVHLPMAGLRCFADSAELSLPRQIFPCFDMGASMEEGHFGTGAYKVQYMLDEVTRDDLVLLDEVGGGTEPEAEREIARGISDALIKYGITTFNTTHDKAAWIAHKKRKGVAFLRVADLGDEERKYKVWPGIAKGGYGMTKARELGIDPESADRKLGARLSD
jgi:hypothetical protein